MKRQSKNFKFQLSATLILLALLFQTVSPALACGPFTVDPLFSFTKHADYPLPDYTKGNVGVVPNSFGRMSLYVFYRQLNNLPFTPNEQKQVVRAMKVRIGGEQINEDKPQNGSQPSTTDDKPGYIAAWKDARSKVLTGSPEISTDKTIDENYSYIHNCLPDAFKNATSTLEARIAKYGTDPNVKEWIAGQDAVFSNCDADGKIPAQLSETSPEWLRKDRQYQIAAALFYTNKLAESRAAFQQIAEDKNSDWNKTARFVAARTYIRQASYINDEEPTYDDQQKTSVPANMANTSNTSTISNSNTASIPMPKVVETVEEKKKKKDDLQQKAYAQLKEILTDASMSEFHASAQRLLSLVEFRLSPLKRRNELGQILSSPTENLNIYNDLTDYVWLLDKVESDAQSVGSERDLKEAQQAGKEQDYSYGYNLKIRDVPADERASDLTDWLFTYESEDGLTHAFEKWQAMQKPSWLVAALVQAKAKSPQIADLLNGANKISSTSPAYATVRYEQIRLLLETNKRAEAKQKLDEVFANNFDKLNISSQNKFFAQRMTLAANLDEFLKYAQRRPATFIWSDDGNEEGTDLTAPAAPDSENQVDQKLQVWAKRTMFDSDAVAFLNEKMPLSILREAALHPQLPDYLKKFLVIEVWTRAFILKNQAVEREFTPLMLKYAPEYNISFAKYAAATTAPNREAAALLTVLRYPVLQPFVPIGYGREDSDPTAIDSNRGNWWCTETQDEKYPVYYDHYGFEHPATYPEFLTAAQIAANDREQNQLKSSGNSATYLTRRALAFATQNPTNPQTPEILHLAVRSTRYGCTDAETLALSKQAFQILHSRYPKSEWTGKTPYYFGEKSN